MRNASSHSQATMASRTGTEEVSTREFQRKLFDWFEKRGLLAELRAFMRHRMISALYSSESPCPASHFATGAAVSPTLQAMLLLVAEFLVQQEYHYSMSVMVAEAPLLASFPKFSGYVSYMSQTDTIQKGCNFPRYSERDVQEILEVFGMTPDSESMKHVLRLYSNNSTRESLLACVLTALSVIVQSYSNETYKKDKPLKNRPKVTDDTDGSSQWIEEIRLVLLRAQLTSHQLQQVEELLRKLHTETSDKARREERENNKKLSHIREQELLAEALVREERFRAQTLEADEDLRNKQKHLEQVTNQLRQQHDEVLNRLNRVQRHADEVKRQENELMEREKALERKQALFEEEHRGLAELRSELQEAAQSLRQEHSEAKTLVELNHLQERCLHLESELKETKNSIFASTVNRKEMGVQATEMLKPDVSNPNKDMGQIHEQYQSSGSSLCSSTEKLKDKKERNSQVTLLKRVVRRVQQENSELRAIAAQQRRRIDELTSKAAQLVNHIAEQSEATSLPRTEQPVLVPEQPPQPPPVPPRHVFTDLRDGGDVNQAASRQSPAFSAHTLKGQGRDWRRKAPKRVIHNMSQTTSFSSDESPTEEVLREARNRLRRLEQESEAVDRRYRDFRARQADSLVSSASMLFAANKQTVGQSFPEAAAPHVAPSLRRSTPFASPPKAGYAAPQLATSMKSPSANFAAMSSSFSTFPRSQFTFPERPLNSFARSSSSPRLSETVPSVQFHSSVLRNPADRLRNLLVNRPSFTSRFANDNGSAPDASAGIHPNQSIPISTPIQEERGNPDPPSIENEVQKLNLNTSPSKVHSSDKEDVSGKAASAENVSHLVGTTLENQQDPQNTSLQYPSLKDDARTEGIRDLNKSASGAVEVPHPSVSALNVSLPPLKLLLNNEQSAPLSSLIAAKPASPSLSNIKQQPVSARQPSPVSSLDIDKPRLSLNNMEQLPNHPPPPSTEIVRSPERDIFKSNLVDATLNEISTLSSSPGLSNTNAGSLKNKTISITAVGHYEDGKENRKPLSPSSVSSEDQNKKSKQENDISKFVALQIHKNDAESSVPGKASQLLNTSLSSIEISEQRLSAGSGGKPTDDDDDFW